MLTNFHLSAFVLIVLGTQLTIFVNAGPTLAPPSTFDPVSTTLSGSITASPSGSSHASGSSTQTASTAFPSLGNYPPCVTNCLAVATSSVNCSSVVDVNCYCKNNTFAQSIVSCISKDCPDPQTLSTAESLAQQFCNVANSSTSLSFPSTSLSPSSTPSSSAASSTPTFPTPTTSSAPTTTTSSAAMLTAKLPHDVIGLQALYTLISVFALGAYII